MPIDLTPVSQEDRQTLTRGNTEFAAKIYRQLGGEAQGNLFLSPWSISSALAMTFAGARGETAEEIAAALEFDLPAERIHLAFQDVAAGLAQSAGPNETQIANAFWADRGYAFRPEYLDSLREHYGALAKNVDFASDPEAARSEINDWISERTREHIRDLFSEGSITDLTRLVLANAIYFKGKWEHPFEAERTREELFTGPGGVESPVFLMRQTEDFGYAREDGFQLLEMPYLDSPLTMLIVLPDSPDGLPATEALLSGPTLQNWMAAPQKREVETFVPRFEMSGEFDLVSALQALGARRLFGRQADLSGMDGSRNLSVGAAIHKAWVSVDEEGTEAAAATGIGIALTSVPPPPPTFRADHPFLFMIIDRESDTILFIGRMVEP